MNIWSGLAHGEDSSASATWGSLSEGIEKNNPFLRMLIKQKIVVETWEDGPIEAVNEHQF